MPEKTEAVPQPVPGQSAWCDNVDKVAAKTQGVALKQHGVCTEEAGGQCTEIALSCSTEDSRGLPIKDTVTPPMQGNRFKKNKGRGIGGEEE